MNPGHDNDDVVTSPRNPQVVAVAGLHDPRRRKGSGLTLVEGPHQVNDVVAAGAEVRHLYLEDGDGWAPPPGLEVPMTRVSAAVMRRIAGTEHPRGPVAVVAEPPPAPVSAVDTVVLWNVADPGNVGAISRSAAAFGFSVAVTAGTSDPWGPKAVRSGAGAQFRTPISVLYDDPVDTLVTAGLGLVATVASGGIDPRDLPVRGPVAPAHRQRSPRSAARGRRPGRHDHHPPRRRSREPQCRRRRRGDDVRPGWTVNYTRRPMGHRRRVSSFFPGPPPRAVRRA